MNNPFDYRAAGVTEEAPTDYWDDYDVPSAQSAPPLLKGGYIFRVPEIGEEFKIDKTGEGLFCYKLNPVVSEGALAGRKVNFVKRSVKKYSNRNGSMAGDLIVGCELDLKPRTNEEWAAAMATLAGKEFGAFIDLRVWDKVQNRALAESQDELPRRVDGSPKLYLVVSADGTTIISPDPEAEKLMEEQALAQGGRKLWANAQITKIIPVSEMRKLLAPTPEPAAVR